MRKILVLIIISVATFTIFNSCRKDVSHEQYTPTTDTAKADLSTKITASVSGFITDENNKAVSGAQVTGGTQTVSTDQYGYFKISNASLTKTAAFIKVTFAGYFNGYRTFIANEGKETFIRLKLIPKTAIGTINASIGGTATTSDGSSVTLPANAVVNATGNVAYTGAIHVAAHWINPTDSNNLQLNMPGNLLGIDTSGYLKVLTTYGMLAVELTDDAGNLLQIATGEQATLSFPIPSSLLSSAPATIPLWSFGETNGLWKQESSATKKGNNYVGSVSHFSYWNCDTGSPLVNFMAQIVDSSLHPLANFPVSISIAGESSSRAAFTDTAGFVYGKIPANSHLILNVLTPCSTTLYSKSFTTENNDIDLGTIATNPSASSFVVTINGNVIDCNSNPVVTGNVMITGADGIYNFATITNGKFSSTITSCSVSQFSAAIIATDETSGQQSQLQSIIISPGINNLDTISACNSINNDQYITVSIDGNTPASFTIPFDATSTAAYVANFSGTTGLTSINYISYPDSFNLPIQGNLGVGIDSFSVSSQNPNGPASLIINSNKYANPNTNLGPGSSINITEYGAVGAFISGNFSADYTTLNGVVNVNHTITCSFRVKRTS